LSRRKVRLAPDARCRVKVDVTVVSGVPGLGLAMGVLGLIVGLGSLLLQAWPAGAPRPGADNAH